MKEVYKQLLEDLANKTPDELEQEYEELTHEKFYERWAEKIKNLGKEARCMLINKLKNKYESDEYINSEYNAGYEPRHPLYDLLYEYAYRYGDDVLLEYEEQGDILDFCTGLFIIDNEYIIERLDGQGTIISVFTKDEYRNFQNGLKFLL